MYTQSYLAIYELQRFSVWLYIRIAWGALNKYRCPGPTPDQMNENQYFQKFSRLFYYAARFEKP